MAIAYTTGGAGSRTTAGTSVAAGAFVSTAGRDLDVAVALSDTTMSVSSITDTAGNTYTLKASVNNGGNVRTELWRCHNSLGNASNVVTANLSGSCLAAIAAAEHSGAGTQSSNNTSTATGNGTLPGCFTTLQFQSAWAIGALGFACVSGDTVSAWDIGSLRQSSIPAATAVGVALVDYTPTNGSCRVPTFAKLSTSRQWAAAGYELGTGGSTVISYGSPAGFVDSPSQGVFTVYGQIGFSFPDGDEDSL